MIRRFFTRLLMVVLIGFCGFNWMQTRALQAQVADLEARQTAQTRQVQQQADWIARASTEASSARGALARSDWKAAARGLNQGVQDLQNGVQAAVQSPQTRRGLHTIQDLQKQMGALRRQANALWHRAESSRERK